MVCKYPGRKSRFPHPGARCLQQPSPFRFKPILIFHSFEIMKASFFSIVAAALLLTSASSFAAASVAAGPFDNHGPYDRFSDRNSKDFNYGFDKKHRVTPQERNRWEADHRNDDRRDNDRRNDRNDDRFDRNQNYGFDRDHRVTPQERARWEAAHRNDHR
jgi:hypothetical protein